MELENGWKLIGEWLHGPNGERVRSIRGSNGSSGGGDPQTVTNTGDPQLARMNDYMTGQLIDAGNSYGGLSGLLKPQPWMFTDFGNAGGPESGVLNRMKDFYSRDPLDAYSAEGMNAMRTAADPTAMMTAGRDIFNTITGPSIRNNSIVSGMGPGATNEALTDAGTRMALPILQQSNQNKMGLGQNLEKMGLLLNQREQGNLSGLYSLAAMPRMEQGAAEGFGRNNLLSMLGRYPVSSGAGSATTTGMPGMPDQTGQMISGGLSALMSIAMMAAMFCHVAYALWAESDPRRFLCAFYEVNFEPHGWLGRQALKLYGRYGRRAAKSKLALKILKPVFERIARRGARKLGVTL